MNRKTSVVIPAKNEGHALSRLLPRLKELYPDFEIIVVNDGSTDDTSKICAKYSVKEIVHPYSKGNGAAVKTGARAAVGDYIVFMDGDGQHKPEDVGPLLSCFETGGFDMVVGSRGRESQASLGRFFANSLYNKLSSWVVGHQVRDLTSGFRIVCAQKFKEFLYLLPNGFSYPTTSTMAFFRAGYSVHYMPIIAESREGRSHINIMRDGVRFLLIIFKICALYSPLKLFFPLALMIFVLASGWYGYTYITFGRFTNMSALLYANSVMIFLMGLISEQITQLMYKDS